MSVRAEGSGGAQGVRRQVELPEDRYAEELAFLAAYDDGPRPPGWRLTPRAVVVFVCGSGGEALESGDGRRLVVSRKFVGDRALVERCVVTLAGERGLLLVGEPGTAKSMLSELLAAAVCGTSTLTVQGTAGTTEDQLRYGWNYAMLLAKGPSREALVPSPVLTAMVRGAVARVEEVTRCLPEVQDSLVSLLSERRMSVPELAGTGEPGREGEDGTVHAAPGFTLIATANLRDRGVSEMSAALKRRFNFETVGPIDDVAAETELVRAQATAALARGGAAFALDEAVLEALVTAFRDLRTGRSAEGWEVERPSTVMSTAEAVQVATSMGLGAAYLGNGRDVVRTLPGHLLGTVRKDDPADHGRLLGYWDGPVRRRAEGGAPLWRTLWELRDELT
ncbi:AAA family ATPase [Streptomyces sp. NPDC045431]|uniref:ATP-binding protein n=1 Tax=Streptomyces sp. NPDC045431 TaxID=3155613 RepID=UPI003405A490